jgi:ligand-binding SRPBCC domain-containing protein
MDSGLSLCDNRAMPTIRLETFMNAPIHRCFDLARSVDLHSRSMAKTQERPVAGVTRGVMKFGDSVTWEAVHFGVRQRLTSKIIVYDRPFRFTDEMVEGAFQKMHHVHEFIPRMDGTLMIDILTYSAPLGILGRIAETLLLTRYLRELLLSRNSYIKKIAEAGMDAASLAKM